MRSGRTASLRGGGLDLVQCKPTNRGHTTYTDRGRPSQGDWWVLGDGNFVSFWPPDYQATYVVRWVVAEGAITGLTFTETERGARFEGHYL